MLKRVILKFLDDNQVMSDLNKQQKIKNHMLGDSNCYFFTNIIFGQASAIFYWGIECKSISSFKKKQRCRFKKKYLSSILLP